MFHKDTVFFFFSRWSPKILCVWHRLYCTRRNMAYKIVPYYNNCRVNPDRDIRSGWCKKGSDSGVICQFWGDLLFAPGQNCMVPVQQLLVYKHQLYGNNPGVPGGPQDHVCQYNENNRKLLDADLMFFFNAASLTFQCKGQHCIYTKMPVLYETFFMVPWTLVQPPYRHCDTPTRTIRHWNDSPKTFRFFNNPTLKSPKRQV